MTTITMDPELEFIATYDRLFLCVLFLVCLLSCLYYSKFRRPIQVLYNGIGWILVIVSSLYLGGRELDVGVDTRQYFSHFQFMEVHSWIQWNHWLDLGFYFFMWLFSKFVSWNTFLMFIALIYIGGAYIGMKKLFGNLALFSLLVFIISPNFFQFNINVMRNGYAASIFLLSFFYYRKPRIMIRIMAFSCLCHISMLLPFFLFIITRNLKTIMLPFIIWSISLIMQICGLSIGSIARFFMASSLYEAYISGHIGDDVQTWGSFFMYGMSPVLVAIYFIGIKKFKCLFFIHLMNTFLLSQAIYIQVMTIPFALRFGYLSTFLMPVLLLYPLLKKRYWNCQLLCISLIITILFIIKAKDLLA